jgi:hypothetical protein
MENRMEDVPTSLLDDLSKKLVTIVLESRDKNAVPTELAKKIIYLWRQDQLASKTGIEALLSGSLKVDAEATYRLLDELGLYELALTLRNI